MIGAGSMSHAIASLKANKRERKHFPTKEMKNSIYTSPLVLKKSSDAICEETARRVQLLKNREKIRLGLVIFGMLSLAIICFMILK